MNKESKDLRPGVEDAIKKAIDASEAQIMMSEILLETIMSMDIKGAEADQTTARKQQIQQEIKFNKLYLEKLKHHFKNIIN